MAFYRRFSRKSSMSKPKSKSKSKSRRSTKKTTFAKKVLRVVHSHEETKYVAEGADLGEAKDTLQCPTDLDTMIPALGQGTQSNERIGSKIQDVRGRVDFYFVLNPGTTSENTQSQDVIIKMFILKSKQVKSFNQVSSIPTKSLLDVGDDTTTDWDPASEALNLTNMPLARENFMGRVKYIHLRKNFGQANGGTESSVLTYGQIYGRCSIPWKHAGMIYDNANSLQPTNYFPIYAFVAYNADGSTFNGQVQVYRRKHMWFKDS